MTATHSRGSSLVIPRFISCESRISGACSHFCSHLGPWAFVIWVAKKKQTHRQKDRCFLVSFWVRHQKLKPVFGRVVFSAREPVCEAILENCRLVEVKFDQQKHMPPWAPSLALRKHPLTTTRSRKKMIPPDLEVVGECRTHFKTAVRLSGKLLEQSDCSLPTVRPGQI